MTATDANATTCPNCDGVYSFRQESGRMFCPECRTEWTPGQVRAAPEVTPGAPDTAKPVFDVRDIADQGDVHSTVLDVTYYDMAAGVERVDRYTHLTHGPHTDDAAATAAFKYFAREGETEVLNARVVLRDPADEMTAAEEADADLEAELAGLRADMMAEADAYLERLIGTGVDLEGGQRGVLLGFPDDDHAEVQLRDGSVVTVDFNSILRADNETTEDQVLAVELDDATAEMFGAAALTMACLVIEAGLRSVEGDGADAHLVEPPSGWIPQDADIIPLFEQSSAAAVALLIQTFALPRDVIAAVVEKVRTDTNPILNPEDVDNAE